MSDALAPCPFCQHTGAAYVGAIRRGFAVTCSLGFGGCGAMSGIYDTEAIAIAAWNRRPTPPPTDDGGAFAGALDAYRAVVDDAESTFYQRGCARARVLALHAEARRETQFLRNAALMAADDRDSWQARAERAEAALAARTAAEYPAAFAADAAARAVLAADGAAIHPTERDRRGVDLGVGGGIIGGGV